ncbi:thermonuclease family protein [Rhodococcus sp. NPDC059968]|uniref:thermonuclease family protein n=1 Tax=Rhodococcus sp. NPDC059968 TaxID=3347017 RepID=UPI00366C018B
MHRKQLFRSAQVVEVVDGEAIVTRHPTSGETLTVSVLGIDAPEGQDCWADQSTQFAKDHLLGRAIQLNPESTQPDTDSAGQVHRYVALDNDMDGDYAIKAAREGAARAYTVDYLRTSDRLIEAESASRAADRGLWTCDGGTPAPSPAPAPQSRPAPAPSTPAPSPGPSGNVVKPGAFCSGGTGVTSTGTPMVCAPGSDGHNRWRAAS